MTEKEFFDTNILLYAKKDTDTSKHRIARDLVREKVEKNEACLSVQVLNEFTTNSIRMGYALNEVEKSIQVFLQTFNVVLLTPNICMAAFRITKRYQFSFWDSLIVAAALEAECSVLYTEDLQNGQIIDGVLGIINPFADSVDG